MNRNIDKTVILSKAKDPQNSFSGDSSAFRLRMTNFLLGLIFFYQKFISPFLGVHCRFTPTCSEYASLAIKQFGFLKGSVKAIKRILSCHSFHEGGYDPVSL